MAKYALVFSKYATTSRVIEADSVEQASEIARQLIEDYEFESDIRGDLDMQESEVCFDGAFNLDDSSYDSSDWNELSQDDIDYYLGVED